MTNIHSKGDDEVLAEFVTQWVEEVLPSLIGQLGANTVIEQTFTQVLCRAQALNYPTKNIMIVHGSYKSSYTNEQTHHIELPLTPPTLLSPSETYSYDIFVFTSGTFELESDGGYQNWCYTGHYSQDPNNNKNLTFYDFGTSSNNT
jgi:hypothetical protein